MKRLEDYQDEMYWCGRCSYCKWVNGPAMRSHRFSKICPSIEDKNFHAYSCSGKLDVAWSFLRGRIPFTDKMLDVVYRCTMCGACDSNCRVTMGNLLSNNEILHALRLKCVEAGQALPEHMILIENLKREDNPFGEPKNKRGEWAEGLGLKNASKEKVDVLFHAGCRFSYDEELRDIVRGYASLLKEMGVDIGIAGKEEACCGLRAFDIGFKGEMEKYADDMMTRIASSGATKLVTACSDGYSAFKYYYPWVGVNLNVEILHVTEYLDQLIKKGKLKFDKELPMKVTYHDPCHLGRLGEIYEPWDGEWKEVLGHMPISEPPKPLRSGENGVYDAPRNILKSIPGLELVEMERNRVNTWCCGAGGGALEAFPDFAYRTATERIEEAKASGADALVTACPWCERTFRDALKENEDNFEIYDIIELVGRTKK
jgi:Fe-S oxidoreductase